MTRQRVLVAMSGGVDSAVAAGLLLDAGYEVLGVTMHLWDYGNTSEASGSGRCCGPVDVRDARRVASALGIRHYVLDFKTSFRDTVVGPFVQEYLAGRTPIPCVACNRSLKFDALVDRAAEVGADLVATGHYVRRRDGRDGRPRLLRAVDRRKDQTYFLFNLPPARIARTLFPVGELTKEQVRDRARVYGLPVAEKPESQEICFIPDGKTGAFLAREMGERTPGPGPIVDERDHVLGEHAGIHRYTVGQRRGLGLSGGPWYVLRLDASDNRVIVGPESDLRRETFKVSGVHWNAGRPPRSARVSVKIRHGSPEAEARVTFLSADSAEVTLAAPARAVAPGQAAVFYRGDLLLGGGWIA